MLPCVTQFFILFYICISSSFCQLKFCNWECLFVICLFRITNINIKAIKILKNFANLNHKYKRYFDGYILWHTPMMVWQLWCTDLIIESYGRFQFFFYLGFLSRTFTIHRTVGEGGGYLFNSSLPFPPALQTLIH